MGNFTATYGVREWAKESANFIRGCAHDCRYCYAKEYAIRGGRCTPKNWQFETINYFRLMGGNLSDVESIMFPSSHDITPQYLRESLAFLGRLLVKYPKVLVVSKPHKECITAICQQFPQFRDKMMFRFTIGSADDAVLRFWEPNAPSLQERMECLQLAHEAGYQTSVSCEPMLDNNIAEVVRMVHPFITDSIWLGKANELIDRCRTNGHDDPETMARASELLGWQSNEHIRDIYQRFKDDPLVRMKSSFRDVVDR